MSSKKVKVGRLDQENLEQQKVAVFRYPGDYLLKV